MGVCCPSFHSWNDQSPTLSRMSGKKGERSRDTMDPTWAYKWGGGPRVQRGSRVTMEPMRGHGFRGECVGGGREEGARSGTRHFLLHPGPPNTFPFMPPPPIPRACATPPTPYACAPLHPMCMCPPLPRGSPDLQAALAVVWVLLPIWLDEVCIHQLPITAAHVEQAAVKVLEVEAEAAATQVHTCGGGRGPRGSGPYLQEGVGVQGFRSIPAGGGRGGAGFRSIPAGRREG